MCPQLRQWCLLRIRLKDCPHELQLLTSSSATQTGAIRIGSMSWSSDGTWSSPWPPLLPFEPWLGELGSDEGPLIVLLRGKLNELSEVSVGVPADEVVVEEDAEVESSFASNASSTLTLSTVPDSVCILNTCLRMIRKSLAQFDCNWSATPEWVNEWMNNTIKLTKSIQLTCNSNEEPM